MRLGRRGVAIANAITMWSIRLGIPRPPYTRRNALIIETTGRRSGRRRRIPVGFLEDEGRVIVVAEDGDRAGWVRNAQAQEGRLRVHIAGRWTAATLQVLDDEPEPYLQRMNKVHAALVRAHSTEMKVVELTIGDGGTLMDRTPASPEDE